MLTFLFAMALAQDTACPEPTDTLQLLNAIERGENAWSLANGAEFNAANAAMAELLPCLGEPLTRSMAARVHRMNGLYHFLNRQQDEMELSFAAARATAPAFRWPADLVPPDHPVLDGYNARAVNTQDVTATLAPVDGSSHFDGRETLDRPNGLPTLHQHLDAEGAVAGTWLLAPDAPLPDYPRVAPVTEGAIMADTDGTQRGARMPMLIAAGSGFVLSGLAYGLAASASGNYYNDPGATSDDLNRYRNATNQRYWASVGLAGASTLTTVGAFAVARW